MDIIFFTEVYGSQVNGVVRAVDLFSEQLGKEGHAVNIVHPGAFGQNTYLELRQGYSLWRWTPSKEVLKLAGDADILHAHSPFIAGYLAKRSKTSGKLVFTHHSLYDRFSHYVPLLGNSGFFKRMLRKYVTGYCNSCDHVIVSTRKVRELLLEQGVTAPMTIIPTGIRTEEFRVKSQRRGYLLSVGRLAKEKSQDRLIRAVSMIPGAKLIIAGEGPMKDKLKRLAGKLGVDVRFPGLVSKQELVRLYNSASVFVSASQSETLGLVYVEAMAAGLPIVAINSTGSCDVVKHGRTGYLADNEEQLADYIEKARKNSKLKDGAVRESDNYDIRKVTRRLLELYES